MFLFFLLRCFMYAICDKIALLIGRGGYATVHKAILKGKDVVAKMIHKGYGTSDKLLFAKEAKLLSDIDHENIVKLLGVCENPVTIVMEYMSFSFKPFNRDNSFCKFR